MNKKVNEYKLNVSQIKIMKTIMDLNALDMYPNVRGVEEVLSGDNTEYENLITFGTLISVQGRKMCSIITQLVRHQFVTYVYDEKTDDMYLTLTTKGKIETNTYLDKHQIKLNKKVRVSRPNIVCIKK